MEGIVEPCPECGAGPDDDHASWCLFEEEEEGEEQEEAGAT